MPRKSRQTRPRSRTDRQAEPSAYDRTTITIPRQLKARMKAAGERVNWSAVASEAFEAWLSGHANKEQPMPELPDKDDAIERLRRLKNEPEARHGGSTGRAYVLGQHWAMADAHPVELQRLEEFCAGPLLDGTWEDLKTRFSDRRKVKKLFRDFTAWVLGHKDRLHSTEEAKLYPADVEQVRRQAKPFWEERVGVEVIPGKDYGPEFLSDFSAGALAFWDEAKEQL
ncbi:hypothetical protein CA54_12930 [Symmachiella macrocystis]|uniref:Uncharacterized protein n=1 Tax=Symmachiella macrocystis TaxID=2527985 RepID=A0A5C6BMZ2_9PLAN|nr:hypothetical protein [Symmachiella macrocystis]TWU12469.1 hypothetical protein CA54_12930 [Symmachiella macrocystis]